MPFFTPDFIDRVRSANELTQVVSSYNVQLKRAGGNMLGLCPFHNEKSPSFNVRPTEQFFRCFGCGAKGDVFGFVQKMEKVEFPEAVRLLAERAGIPLEFDSPEAARQAKNQGRAKSALLWCCSQAADYFCECLAGPGGQLARDYLARRGFEKETLERWRIGWAPDSWDGLAGFLLKNAKDPEVKAKVLDQAVRAGLLRVKDGDHAVNPGDSRKPDLKRHAYDAFRGRVMFPIVDAQARPIAFGGRVLVEKANVGKYINSPEGPLFSKRTVLFGLTQAAKEIALTGEAVVVEGYTDAIMCHQYGIRNVVATLGTALTAEHIDLLRRYLGGKGRVVAFFDSDNAGRLATRRAIDLFMERDVPLAVATDLELKDAGEFLPRYGAEEFRKKLQQAEDSFAYMVKRTLGLARDRDPQAMSVAVREVMATVNLCPEPVTRSLMRQKVAAAAGISEETLPEPVEKAPAVVPGVKAPARPGVKRGLVPGPAGAGWLDAEALWRRSRQVRIKREARLLRYMWENPEWCLAIADAYPPDEWKDGALSEVAALTRDEWDSGRRPVLTEIQARTRHQQAGDRLADLAFPEVEPLSERDMRSVLALLLEENRKEEIELLKRDMEAAQRCGDSEKATTLWASILQMKRKGGGTGG